MEPNEPSLFLKMDGRYFQDENRNYFTFLTRKEEQYIDSEITRIVDPSYDCTFNFLFSKKNIDILINMINSIFFPDSKVIELEILDREVSFPNTKFDKSSIRADLICKAKLKNDNIIMGIEIQIGYYENFTNELFKYQTGLSYVNNNKKTWTIGFFINTKKTPEISSEAKLRKVKEENMETLDICNMIEIDLEEQINKIIEGEDIIINNKLIGTHGKEWIKLLGLRLWCRKSWGKYILPKNLKLSDNSCFNEAIKILALVPEYLLLTATLDEKDYRQFIENNEKRIKEAEQNGAKKQSILSAFTLFKAGYCSKPIKLCLQNKKFTSEEVNSALEDYIIEDNKENDKDRFISFLEEYKFIK